MVQSSLPLGCRKLVVTSYCARSREESDTFICCTSSNGLPSVLLRCLVSLFASGNKGVREPLFTSGSPTLAQPLRSRSRSVCLRRSVSQRRRSAHRCVSNRQQFVILLPGQTSEYLRQLVDHRLQHEHAS
jgi:hypothetical protein